MSLRCNRTRFGRLATKLVSLVSVVSALVVGVLSASAMAAGGDLPGHARPLGAVSGILIFVVAPVGTFLLVAVLCLRPGAGPKSLRYRPGRGWDAPPAWFGSSQGGARASAPTPAGLPAAGERPDDHIRSGGASGSW